MRSTFAFVTAAAIVFALALPVASAHETTRSYEAANAGTNCFDLEVLVPEACDDDTTDGYGGGVFEANGEQPATVTVTDDVAGPVYFLACQNPDGDQVCGQTGEPAVFGCGSADLSESEIPFDPELDTQVYVYAAATLAPADCGIGTTGTIQVTYAT